MATMDEAAIQALFASPRMGLDWRIGREGSFTASDELRSDDVIGIGPENDIGGSTYVIEVFGEFNKSPRKKSSAKPVGAQS